VKIDGRYAVRSANDSDISHINSIMESASAEINNIDIFYADNLDFIKGHIEAEGFTLVVLSDDIMVGFLIVRIPNHNEDNLWNDVSLDCSVTETVHMESVVILPEHRGHGLQKELFVSAERIAAAQGFAYAMATVSPMNMVSLNNMLEIGYRIMKTKEKYGSMRHIMAKRIQ
jgi:ribosomal protein S18 acetylase RimI-like enzyme